MPDRTEQRYPEGSELEKLLREAARTGAGNTAACPDDWQAYFDGQLPPQEAAGILAHLGECERCALFAAAMSQPPQPAEEEQAQLAALASSAPGWRPAAARAELSEKVTVMEPRKAGVRWWAWAAALAAVALPLSWRLLRPPDVMTLLASAYTNERTFVPRLPGAAHGPVRVERSASAARLNRPKELLRAESLIADHKEDTGAEWLHARGRAEILEWNADAAIETLRQVVAALPETSPRRAEAQVDLAIAHFQRAEASKHPPDFATAANVLTEVLKREPDNAAALFNRAVTYERLYFFEQALQDWDRFLKVESAGPWAAEARERREGIVKRKAKRQAALIPAALDSNEFLKRMDAGEYTNRSMDVFLNVVMTKWLDDPHALPAVRRLGNEMRRRHRDAWLSDLVAEPRYDALRLLSAASRSILAERFADAARESEQAEALFARYRNAAGIAWARTSRVNAAYRSLQQQPCIALSQQSGREPGPYALPRLWRRAYEVLCLMRSDRREDARGIAEQSFSDAERQGYGMSRLYLGFALAAIHMGAGNVPECEALLHELLEAYWADAYRMQDGYTLYMQLGSAAEARTDIASALSAARESVQFRGAEGLGLVHALGRYRLATLSARLRAWDDARRYFEEWDRLIAAVPRNATREAYENEAEASLALLEAQGGDPVRAREHVARAELRPGGRTMRTTNELRVAKGLIEYRSGRRVEALSVLRPAVKAAGLPAADASAALLDLEWEQDRAAAFDLWISQRGLRDRADLWRRLAGRTLVVMTPLPHGVALWVAGAARVTAQWSAVERSELVRLIEDYRLACEGRRPDAGYARRLFDLLIAPVKNELNAGEILLDSGPLLEVVPFNALPDRNGAPLAESNPVTLWIPEGTESRPSPAVGGKMLLVHGPANLGRLRGWFPSLPDGAEIDGVRRVFPRALVLTDRQATPGAVARELRSAHLFHFAGHALAGEAGAGLLLSAPDGQDPVLLSDKSLADARFDQCQLAVLAACRTALSGQPGQARNLARFLVRRGVRQVIGSLWDIDSASASRLFEIFYSRLKANHSVSASLQDAVRQIRAQPATANPRFWAPFVLYSN